MLISNTRFKIHVRRQENELSVPFVFKGPYVRVAMCAEIHPRPLVEFPENLHPANCHYRYRDPSRRLM
jgi:hypothetical protein